MYIFDSLTARTVLVSTTYVH